MESTLDVVLAPPDRFRALSPVQWLNAGQARPNLLLEGAESATLAALLALKPHVRRPVLWRQNGAPLELPTGDVGALILPNVGALDASEQAALLAWIGGPGLRAQVVSTSPYPLFPLVMRRQFDEVLYYRLNVVLLHIDSARAEA
jgi:hypothetical protein